MVAEGCSLFSSSISDSWIETILNLKPGLSNPSGRVPSLLICSELIPTFPATWANAGGASSELKVENCILSFIVPVLIILFVSFSPF